jgi:hypothetical protein
VVKGGDTFNKTNGADGNQILLIRSLGIVFFHNVCHQAQIPFDQYISGFQVTLGSQSKVFFFLLPGKGSWETPGGKLQVV